MLGPSPTPDSPERELAAFQPPIPAYLSLPSADGQRLGWFAIGYLPRNPSSRKRYYLKRFWQVTYCQSYHYHLYYYMNQPSCSLASETASETSTYDARHPLGFPQTTEITTVAQFVAAHSGPGYLRFAADCVDLADLLQCLALAGSSNCFDAEQVANDFRKLDSTHRNENGDSLFSYSIAWEGSLAVYVKAKVWDPAAVGTPSPLSFEEFEGLMSEFGRLSLADESFDLPQAISWLPCWRFWWD